MIQISLLIRDFIEIPNRLDMSKPLKIKKRKVKNGAAMFLTVFDATESSSRTGRSRRWRTFSKWRTMLQLEDFPNILEDFCNQQRSALKRYVNENANYKNYKCNSLCRNFICITGMYNC